MLSAWKALQKRSFLVTGYEVPGYASENDVPGRHYAIGPCPQQAYCLPGRLALLLLSEDFVPGYYRYALYCLPGSSCVN